ncbi:MAG: FtsW/RodA/SpoVE family cell cycle protein [Ignavibacteria bacterium]|nr:FtsW/RodA/SpoVE family cell cycle protein [Ignavibacteria bacterium]
MFSIAFVYSASASFADVKFGSSEELVWNHAIRVLVGLTLMIVFAKIDYRVWQGTSATVLLVAIGFLLMVLVMGTEIKGASRWVKLGPVNFQPSELAKFALVIHTAALLSTNRSTLRTWKKGILPIMVWVLPVCILIAPATQPIHGKCDLPHCYGDDVLGRRGYQTSAHYCWYGAPCCQCLCCYGRIPT